MAFKSIASPEILINGDKISIVPNTLTYDAGEGEINVRAASMGGGKSESVHTLDPETQIGMIKFSVFNTPDLDGLIAELKALVGEIAISFAEKIGTDEFVRQAPGLSLVNAVEREVSADGTTALEFSGDQFVTA